MKYTVTGNLSHNGTDFAPGSTVELTPAQAAALIKDGMVADPNAPVEAPADTEAPVQKPEPAPEKEEEKAEEKPKGKGKKKADDEDEDDNL